MRWLKIDRVIAIHQLQIAEHGGAAGLRDRGLLESALARPVNLPTYEQAADIPMLAAAYAFGIIRNHPFVDGNKRTGYVVMETFLLLNGLVLEATPQDKFEVFLTLAGGTLSENTLADWLRLHTRQGRS